MPIQYIDGVVLPQAREDGYIVSADTLEELAEKLGLPKENFVATCQRYNECYDNQDDPDFGKEAFRLSQMRKAPFEGIRMSGGYFINTFDGVKVNCDMNVLDENMRPIEGLYMPQATGYWRLFRHQLSESSGRCVVARKNSYLRSIGGQNATKPFRLTTYQRKRSSFNQATKGQLRGL